jgi:MFS family permease
MFGLVHVLVFLFSVLLWLLLAAWNTRAAAWSMGYTAIGLLNFTSYMAYVASALTLGHLGDRIGFKRPLAAGFLALALILPLGFFWRRPWTLFLTACLVLVFYGFFYPSVEGLLSHQEVKVGVHPFSTTARFSLSWSSGNIAGMLFGPWLIEKSPRTVFAGGIALCLAAAAALWSHWRRHGDRLPRPRAAGFSDRAAPHLEKARMRGLRLGARAALLPGSLAFIGTMLLFPKVLSAAGVPLANVGFITAFGNLAVFATFLALLPTRFWIGRPGLCASLSAAALLLFGISLATARSPALLALAVALGGVAYAMPYTFALYYGLSTPDSDNARQGAIHETLIGLSQGAGPLAAGLLLGAGTGLEGMGLLVIGLGVLSFGIQMLLRARSAGQPGTGVAAGGPRTAAVSPSRRSGAPRPADPRGGGSPSCGSH